MPMRTPDVIPGLLVLLALGCGKPEKPTDAGASGGGQLICPAGLRPYYGNPGCDRDAVAVCAASDDGCLGPEICTCDGKTSRLCSWHETPFRHFGACGTDGGPARPGNRPLDAAPLSCECGAGRTCTAGAIYASDCAVCECRPNGQSVCQGGYCVPPDGGVLPPAPRCEDEPSRCGQGDCIYDVGCEAPRAYCAKSKCSATFSGTFCGCDGQTFTTDCPLKPYRHVGACGS